jgi:ubiquinone/menaquinone biosynthesis C-methylase UbiE
MAVLAMTAGTLFAQAGHEEKRVRLHGEVFRLLDLKPGHTVADIGAGAEGLWSIPLSQKVADGGTVLAEDIDQQAVEKLRKLVSEKSIKNIKVLLGDQSDPKLPASQVDAILIAMTYHEFGDVVEMLSKLRAALKPGGRLVIFESVSAKLRKQSRTAQTKEHEISPDRVGAELRAAGFAILETVDPLWPDPETSRYLVAARR